MSLSNPNGFPVLKLHLQGMEQTLAVAMSEYTLQLDEMLQTAIQDFCTPENLRRIVEEQAYQTLDTIVKESVKYWFLQSEDGQKMIKHAVAKKLKEEAKYYE